MIQMPVPGIAVRDNGRVGDTTLGWREWAELPSWYESPIKAKLDTGARTSALHAFALELVRHGSVEVARFEIHPEHGTSGANAVVEAEVSGYREVRSSNGAVEMRPMVVTDLSIAGQTFPIELTLTDRDLMGFRLLLGREALRGRFVIDSGRSYLAGSAR